LDLLELSIAKFEISEGFGKKSMTPSSNGWTPLFFRAVPR
jgi:hypothetical protein